MHWPISGPSPLLPGFFLQPLGWYPSEDGWVPPVQVCNPCQTHLGKVLPARLCPSAHNPPMAPSVFRIKSNHLMLAFKSFQSLTPAPFPMWLPTNISISSRVTASRFPPFCNHLCLLYSVLLVSPVLWKSSITSFFQSRSGLSASHWVFLIHLLELLFNVVLGIWYLSNSTTSNLGSVNASARLCYLPQSH